MITLRRLSILILVLSLTLPIAAPVLADTSYTVQPGDTLTKIATRFNVTTEALIQANNLKNANAIQIGQTLVIPDGSAPAAQPASTGPQTYIVQNGDSLFRIASKFNVTVDALIAANNLTSNTLRPGQTLIIPGSTPAPVATITNAVGSVYDRISGPQSFVNRVKAGLDWLQAHDADAYNRVDTYVTTITPSPYSDRAQAAPLPGGGCLVRALARRNMSAQMVAALLYHEASHCYQFAAVGVLTSKEAEVYAYSEQIAFMERNNFPKDTLDFYRKVLDYYASQPDDGKYIPPPDF
ncbi:MAG: LysM peptidoglycan-binding domain-containing protein [Chloroflexi bacterium]|nr:LysM peptidoglycan-binding domain-containing protein [Chloroflexota bacterium]